MEYISRTITGSQICTLIQHWIPFTTHNVLYQTSVQCVQQLPTRPKASNGGGPTIIYSLMRWRQRWLLQMPALQPIPLNTCQAKVVFKRMIAFLICTVSVTDFSKTNTQYQQSWVYNWVASITCWIWPLFFCTACWCCLFHYIFRD